MPKKVAQGAEQSKDAAAAELQGAAAEYLAAKKKKKAEDDAAADLQGAAAGYLASKRAKAAEATAEEEPGFGEQVGTFFSDVGQAISHRFQAATQAMKGDVVEEKV